MFRWDGKIKEMGLGSAQPGHVSLKEARQRADAARAMLRDGVSPLNSKRAGAAEAVKFGAFADELVEDIAAGFSNEKHIAQWRMTLDKYAAPIRDLPLNAITTEHVLSILKPIWTTKAETASRLRGRIERVLSAAKARGLRSGDNPAQWRGHLDQMLSKRRKLTRGHHPALPYADVPDFICALRRRSAAAGRALEFLILTASRSGEVRGARWREINLDEGIWIIPAVRMKAKREHRVPLTARMIELLGQPPADLNALVFAGRGHDKPLSETAFSALLDRMGHSEITAHGFRSSFRDWASEETSTSHEVAEMALAHVIANKTEAAYRRGDLFEKRRTLMNAWEAHCSSSILSTDLHTHLAHSSSGGASGTESIST
jgi:integrase